MTVLGGAYNNEYRGFGCGTIFKVTAAGVLTKLHNFCASGWPCTDGWDPSAALVQANDGNLYGTTIATVF